MQHKGTGMEVGTNTDESAAEVAANLVGANLLQAVLDQLERIEAWRKLDTFTQDNAIATLRETVRAEVRRALAVVFAGQYPACVATLTGVTFGDEISAKLKIGKSAHHRHELADSTGQPVLVVLAEADGYFAEMDQIRARAKQGELFDETGEAQRADPLQVVATIGSVDDAEPDLYLGDVTAGSPADGLVAALRRAGIDVTFNDTARWSAVDRAQAQLWADWRNNPDAGEVLIQPDVPACLAPLLASHR